ncbi:hypothetical protein CDAR_609261 [Caerostris darwini]|uniref:Uncharacterized protein n=1 Tax=Caerostris darwini TaxID=1538125 RepID=A0AAV4S8Q3_9ARAC|nr:hypothetical protein CDAR_609261 [Caerostris darwini]
MSGGRNQKRQHPPQVVVCSTPPPCGRRCDPLEQSIENAGRMSEDGDRNFRRWDAKTKPFHAARVTDRAPREKERCFRTF